MNKSKCTPPLQHSIADVRRKQERLGQRSAMWLLVGSWNLAKLPSLTTRLHGPTKAATLRVGRALIASMSTSGVRRALFGAFVLHRRLAKAVERPDSGRVFDRMERFHRMMLAFSLLTVFGAVAGSHGLW